eukprot:TRINITY_DN2861_c0_g1_i4.p1 TRINITY_DN2861_c0_g1~~TRINITY_DN2861_c0_g1_i4.p1  ORF type:complete len:244 (+),score=66.30 TRINITY_DN2861_c0_g1_i4:129-860(+)
MCIRDRVSTQSTGRRTINMAHLTYFAGWGLAEQTRWVLAAADIDFTQTAFSTHEQFTALQDSGKLLFRQLPLLEIDGLNLVQSQAMVRYVSRRSGLDGSTPAEAALVDMICEGIRDCRGVVVGFPFAPGRMSAEEVANMVASVPTTIAKQMSAFERALEEGSTGFLPSGLCTADVLLAELVEGLSGICEEAAAPYPKVAGVHRHVLGLPQIQKYLESERRYPFPKEEEVRAAYVSNVNTVLGR